MSWYKRTPIYQTSLDLVWFLKSIHSGATEKGVPDYSSKLLLLSSKYLTEPNPVKFTLSSLSIRIFYAFKSLCMTFLSCNYFTAIKTWVIHFLILSSVKGSSFFYSLILSLSFVPFICSYIIIKCLSSKKYSTILGKCSSLIISLQI